jgi:hypothetical protein
MVSQPWPAADGALLNGCLAGDGDAWRQLHHRYYGPLLRWVTRRLSTHAYRGVSAEDIAAAVWEALWTDHGRRLRAYDSSRASFATYLRMLARARLRLLFRRHPLGFAAREVALGERDLADEQAVGLSFEALLEDFLPLLTPRERWFLLTHLLGGDGTSPEGRLSPDSYWKLRQRIWLKLLTFLQDQ